MQQAWGQFIDMPSANWQCRTHFLGHQEQWPRRPVKSPWCHINGEQPTSPHPAAEPGSERADTHLLAKHLLHIYPSQVRHEAPGKVLQAPTQSANSHFRSKSNESGFLACRGWNQHMRPLNVGQPTTGSSNSSQSDRARNEMIWSRNKNSKSCPESFAIRVKFLTIFSGSSEYYCFVITRLTTFALHLKNLQPFPRQKNLLLHTLGLTRLLQQVLLSRDQKCILR